MAAVKDILRHAELVAAGRRRKCTRHPTKNPIVKGEVCLVITEGQNAHAYCKTCATQILNLAKSRLDELFAICE